MLGRERALEEGQAVVGRREQLGVEEREGDLVARRVDDRVDLLDAPVLEGDAVAPQLGDVGLRRRVAGAETQQQLARDGRVGLQEVVVGRDQPVVLHPARGDEGEGAGEEPLQLQRDVRVRVDQLPDRLAEQVLGHDPGAAAGREEDVLGDALARELGDDVDGAVADPDDEDALADHVEGLGGREVVVRVDRLARELAGELGDAGVPVVAVPDDEELELVGLAVLGGDRPAAVRRCARPSRPGSRSGCGRAGRRLRRSCRCRRGPARGAGSPGTRPRSSACRGTRRCRARCRCGASGRPTSARSGCRSTSCRRCRRRPRSRCRAPRGRPGPCPR